MNNLGNAWHQGKGVEADPKEAFRWYSKASEAGYVLGTYNLGVLWYFGDAGEKSFEKAFQCFSKAAENGFAQAQYNLAGMYHFGEGTEIDTQKAFDWYKKSAENGFATAWLNLGELYLEGEGTEKDIQKAISSFTKAADDGNSEASFELSQLLILDDPIKAIDYLEKSASDGFEPAWNNLAVHYLKDSKAAQKVAEAIDWLNKAADFGVRAAKLNLATQMVYSEQYQNAYFLLCELPEEDEIASYQLAILILSGKCSNVNSYSPAELLKRADAKGWIPATYVIEQMDKLANDIQVFNYWGDYYLADRFGELIQG
jgi:TPR repeat protein